MAWGNNKNNELGTNSYTDYYTPVEAKIANVKEIAAGPSPYISFKRGWSVYSWGNNAQNQRTPAPDYQQYVALTFSDGMAGNCCW